MPPRTERHDAILALLRQRHPRRQSELQDLLARQGHDVNQGTLSRDLRQLGVRKGPGGYELPPDGRAAGPGGELLAALDAWLLAATPAQNLVVLDTPPGAASPLAVAIDQAGLDAVVGTLAGDDTVLIVCPDPAKARRLGRDLLRRKGARP